MLAIMMFAADGYIPYSGILLRVQMFAKWLKTYPAEIFAIAEFVNTFPISLFFKTHIRRPLLELKSW